MEHITSRKNPKLSHIRQLIAQRAYRRECGQMVCEGPKMLAEALAWGAEISWIVQADDAALPEQLPSSIERLSVPADMLSWLADTKTPQQLLFLCSIPRDTGAERLGSRLLILDGLQDPGNLGTIWRTADAFGADGLVLLNHCADPWSPKTLRATMGACFRLPVWETKLERLEEVLNMRGIPLYATALREDTADVRSIPLSRAAVVIGSEGRGVSEATLAACEKTLKIPMRPRCESLNAAAAASVVLWEMARQQS